MAYEKQNFADGEVLTAAQLNHMENGISDASNIVRVNPNLLDNWYFADPINQRGIAVNQKIAGYGLDRWVIEGGGFFTEFKDAYATYNFPEQYAGIVQKIDNYNNFAGKTITCSILIKAYTGKIALMVYDGAAQYGYEHLISNVGMHKISVTLPESISDLWFRIERRGTEDASLEIIAAKLELGSQQTLARQENGVWELNEIPDYGEQLRRCQRYCIRMNLRVFPGKHIATFPVVLRGMPALTVLNSEDGLTAVDTAGGLTNYGFCIQNSDGTYTRTFDGIFSADL